MDPSADKAEVFLRRLGFNCEREPYWIKEGPKPDFYCYGKESIWVEVKTLEDIPLNKKQAYLWNELKRREPTVKAQGDAYVTASEYATEKDIKVILKLAEIISNELLKARKCHRAFAVIPFDPLYDKNINLCFKDNKELILVLSCKSKTGKYWLPYFSEDLLYEKKVSFFEKDSGKRGEKAFYDFIKSESPLICLELIKTNKKFQIKSLRFEKAHSVRNIERLRNCVKSAAKQLKNGQKYKAVPSLVLIYQDNILVPSDILIPAIF